MKDYYRLTNIQKAKVSQNLIDILEKNICPSSKTINLSPYFRKISKFYK